MPEFCTCGAELPPDARFCHRCGKPQRDEPTFEPVDPPPAVSTVVPPLRATLVQAPPGVSFHNPVAVRVALSMASVAALLTWLPLIQLGFAIWWTLAGFFSVYLYHRRTGQLLNVRGGLRMGWVTGVLTFAIMTVLFTLAMVPALLQHGGLAALYQEQLRAMQWNEANIEQAMHALESPAVLATGVVFTLLFLFVIVTCLCTAGGAGGAPFAL
jgi:hypothetical protein